MIFFIQAQISLLLISLTVCEGVRILAVVVPKKALQGDEVHLRCDYTESEGSPLYSLKWYKDRQEFYRYVPASKHSSTNSCSVAATTPTPQGVTVNCVSSSQKEVVLSNVARTTSGEYMCEVIGDRPFFRKDQRKGSLVVHSEPLHRPAIVYIRNEYNVGDPVNLTCISRNREYQPELSWVINGQTVNERDLLHFYQTTPTSLGLSFIADELRFIHGQMRVICKAKIGNSHIQSASKTLAIPGLLRPQYYSKGSEPSDSLVVRLVVATLSLLLF